MPKLIAPAELDALVAAVAERRDGTTVGALARRFPRLPRRSLQRRLARLVADGRLQASGKARARRYHLPTRYPDTEPSTGGAIREDTPAREGGIPLSPTGSRLQARVGQALARRVPVGYARAFLDDYTPNDTFYLSAAMRTHLARLGRSSVAGTRPAGTYARQVLNRLIIDLSWSSSRLEGNTYSRLDTQNLLDFGRAAEGKDRLEAQMILNHKAAIEMLVEHAELIDFNRYTIQNLHALLAENLLPDAGAGGRLRETETGIHGTVYEPMAIPALIAECFDRLLGKARAIDDPFEQAFFAMVHLPYLQPFEDVNKRVSRLAANIPLIKHNLAPLSFVDVPERTYIDGTIAVYELRRIELLRDVFAWAYERSCRRYTLIREALPEPDPLRLRYHEALRRVVGEIVRDNADVEARGIRQLAGDAVAPADMPAFVAMTINELLHLHEGNIARYRLRLSEFHRWQAAHPPKEQASD